MNFVGFIPAGGAQKNPSPRERERPKTGSWKAGHGQGLDFRRSHILTLGKRGHIAQPRPHRAPLALGLGQPRIQARGFLGPTPWKYFLRGAKNCFIQLPAAREGAGFTVLTENAEAWGGAPEEKKYSR